MNKMMFSLLWVCCWVGISFSQTDTVAPVLRCKPAFSIAVNLLPNCYAQLWAIDLLDTLYDTGDPYVRVGIRRACVGDGFPEGAYSVTFDASDLGPKVVEIWAKDKSGNTEMQRCMFMLQAFQSACDPNPTQMTASTPTRQSINGVDYTVKVANCLGDSIHRTVPTSQLFSGQYGGVGYFILQLGYEGLITPRKTAEPLNGVTTLDLALISKHILGLETLDSPYKLIAADANRDGKISTADVVLLRRLIIGLDETFPDGASWRFVPKDYVFPDVADPFQPSFPEAIQVLRTRTFIAHEHLFIGVKLGDVNHSADPQK